VIEITLETGRPVQNRPMDIGPIIRRLIEIEKALYVNDIPTIRNLIWDTQECALRIQKGATEVQRIRNRAPNQIELP